MKTRLDAVKDHIKGLHDAGRLTEDALRSLMRLADETIFDWVAENGYTPNAQPPPPRKTVFIDE